MAKLAQPTTRTFTPVEDVYGYGLQSLGAFRLATTMDPVLRDKAGHDYAVYRDIHREPTVKSAFQQRRSAVVACEREVVPGDDNDPRAKAAAAELNDNLDNINFDGVVRDMLFGVLMGFSVGQLVWSPTVRPGRWWLAEIKRHRQEYFRFDWEGNLYQITRKAAEGERWPREKAWIYRVTDGNTDDPYGLGLGHHLYWSVFFRRNAHRFWQIFLEKFAMPTATAEAPRTVTDNPVERAKVLSVLDAIRREAGVIIPDGIKLGLLEATRSGTPDYEKMIQIADREITIAVLSQSLTTASEGGQYKAEVQETVKEDVVKEDADTLCASFNEGPARLWTDYNYGTDVPSPRLWIKTEPPDDLAQRAERDNKIYALGFEPTEEYVEEWYGEGWVKRETTPPPLPPGTGNNPFAGPGSQEPPPSFAELGALNDVLGGHDSDQIRIKAAARELAAKDPVVAEQIRELAAFAETTQDYATMGKRLRELISDAPPAGLIENLKRASLIARLFGIRRQQR